MIHPRRVLLGVLCVAVGVGAGAAQATSPSLASVPPDSTEPVGAAGDRVLDLVDRLAPTGIEVVPDPGADPLVEVAEPKSPMRLLLFQVAAMELELRDHAGIPVADLDAAVGGANETDDGAGAGAVVMATPSGVIAAWMDMGGTPASMLAAELVGRSDGESPAELGLDVVPQIVLVLFTSDLAVIGASLPEPPEPSSLGWAQPGRAVEPATPAQTGLCSSVIGFVNGVIASVFNAIGHLRNPPLVNTGFSPFDWFVNGAAKAVVGGINAVIDGANFVISKRCGSPSARSCPTSAALLRSSERWPSWCQRSGRGH